MSCLLQVSLLRGTFDFLLDSLLLPVCETFSFTSLFTPFVDAVLTLVTIGGESSSEGNIVPLFLSFKRDDVLQFVSAACLFVIFGVDVLVDVKLAKRDTEYIFSLLLESVLFPRRTRGCNCSFTVSLETESVFIFRFFKSSSILHFSVPVTILAVLFPIILIKSLSNFPSIFTDFWTVLAVVPEADLVRVSVVETLVLIKSLSNFPTSFTGVITDGVSTVVDEAELVEVRVEGTLSHWVDCSGECEVWTLVQWFDVDGSGECAVWTLVQWFDVDGSGECAVWTDDVELLFLGLCFGICNIMSHYL